MKGKYRIILENKTIKYDFEIKRNITIIKGDSATGKTQLVEMIGAYYENGISSGIALQCERECVVLEGRNWKPLLETFHNNIVFIDEGNAFVTSKEFAEAVQSSDNYYVIVTREALATLPYSVEEIYGIRNSGKYGGLKKTYNEMYRIYSEHIGTEYVSPDVIITEDSNAGFQFFDAICRESEKKCVAAFGKSNIFREVQKLQDQEVLIIADGAAFGSEMDKIMSLVKNQEHIQVYLPESFEWLILRSGVVKNNELEEILAATYDHVQSERYVSWERYYTGVLVENTKDTYLAYTKKRLNENYLDKKVKEAVLGQMDGVEL